MKTDKRIQRIVGVIGLIGGILIGIKILIWMVTIVN